MTQISALAASDTFATRRARINEGFVKIQNNETTAATTGVSSAAWNNGTDTITFTRPNGGTLDLEITGFGAPSDATVQAQAALANTNTAIATKLASASYTAADVQAKAALANTNTQIATKISNSVVTTMSARNIIPQTNNTFSLGNLAMQWKDVYIGPGSLYVNGKKVLEEDSGTITFSADTDQSLTIKTLGSGETTVQSATGVNLTASGSGDVTVTTSTGNIELKGTVQILTGKRITDSAGAKVEFGDVIDMNSNKITELAAPAADTDASTKLYVDTSIANLANSAPTTLNTLNELAAALGDDANFATTTASALGLKATEANSLLRLSNTNAYIATKLNSSSYTTADVQAKAALANTNTQIGTKLASASYTAADVQAKAALANTNSRIAALNLGVNAANVAVTVGAGSITTTQDDVALNAEALVNPAGFLTINLGGSTYKLPYFS